MIFEQINVTPQFQSFLRVQKKGLLNLFNTITVIWRLINSSPTIFTTQNTQLII
ncbi:unnamed protein product [Paramecium pentaurelia]|uniref:Uncharacterized protein n=1 Tax=Paramecium pentaurelia TaxID=43138 RepID=A0A8S1VDG3_9CILI|nr:unnamed protein product [Paramecium pentaurelia]